MDAARMKSHSLLKLLQLLEEASGIRRCVELADIVGLDVKPGQIARRGVDAEKDAGDDVFEVRFIRRLG